MNWRIRTRCRPGPIARRTPAPLPARAGHVGMCLRSFAALVMRRWLRDLSPPGNRRARESARPVTPSSWSANHSSHLDTLCSARRLAAAATAPGLPRRRRRTTSSSACRDWPSPRSGQCDAVRAARRRSRHSLDLCRELLANPGNVLILFPEGTRTTTGQLGDFRPGIGALSPAPTIPVVPCYLDGAFAAWPKGKSLPRPCKLHSAHRHAPHLPRHRPHDKESATNTIGGRPATRPWRN